MVFIVKIVIVYIFIISTFGREDRFVTSRGKYIRERKSSKIGKNEDESTLSNRINSRIQPILSILVSATTSSFGKSSVRVTTN